jgi:hypothetical protein
VNHPARVKLAVPETVGANAAGVLWASMARVLPSSACALTTDLAFGLHKIASGHEIRPRLTEPFGPAWGYHLDDIDLALGNLVTDVRHEEAAFQNKP